MKSPYAVFMDLLEEYREVREGGLHMLTYHDPQNLQRDQQNVYASCATWQSDYIHALLHAMKGACVEFPVLPAAIETLGRDQLGSVLQEILLYQQWRSQIYLEQISTAQSDDSIREATIQAGLLFANDLDRINALLTAIQQRLTPP